MKQKINEDNWSGTHDRTVTAGINEATTDIDSPVNVSFPQMVSEPGGYVTPSAGDNTFKWYFNLFSNNTKNIIKNAGGDSGSGIIDSGGSGAGASGVAWFGSHMKEIAIVAASSAILIALVKLIKGASKSIKVRYNKVVKTLQKAQTNFVTNPMGLDMRDVLPGQGSTVYNWLSRLFTLSLFDKKRIEANRTNNIGLYPFCDRYKEEVAKDFKCAVEAFNKIKVVADEEKKNGGVAQEGLNENVYYSFREAYASDYLNEGEEMNESALAAISAGVGLASLAVRGGQFIISKIKDGKPVEDTEKRVRATKESIREICYSIVYNYLDKYVNMDRVFKELGIKSESLSDLDKSSGEKLKMFLEKYQKPEKNQYTKQYARLKTAYDNMLKHYYAIGDGIIKNFEKYTEAKDEKHSNLLIAGKEKLQEMWDAQKDMFNNNFSHILIEIVSSEPYIAYLNFIIEKVMPVFNSGIADDADYVLDVMPKKDQYYLVRQTQEQPWLENGEENNGNVAIARVLGYNSEKQEIQFRLIGLVNGSYHVSDNGIAELTGANVDYDVYKGDDGKKKEVTLTYAKWLSMDPFLMDWKEEVESKPFFRTNKDNRNIEEYLYAYGSKESNQESGREEYNRIVFASYDAKSAEFKKVILMKLANPLTEDELYRICTERSDEPSKNMAFISWDKSQFTDGIINRVNSLKKEEVDVKSTEEIVKNVNEIADKIRIKAASALYKRTTKNERGRDVDQYIFAIVAGDLNSVESNDGTMRLNDRVNEDEESNDEKETSTTVINKGDKGSDKPLITQAIFAAVEAGKSIMGGRKENKFSGSKIDIKPACSIDQFCNFVENEKFTKIEENQDKIRQDILNEIDNNKGSAEVKLSGSYEINKLSDAISLITNRENAAEKLDNSVSEIAQKIIDAVGNINGVKETDPKKQKELFNNQVLHRRDGTSVKRGNYRLSGIKTENGKGFVSVDTTIKGPDGNNIIFDVFPVLMNINKVKVFGCIITIADDKRDNTQTVKFEKPEIENALIKIIKAYKENKQLEDSRFDQAVAAAQETPDASTNTPDSSTSVTDSVIVKYISAEVVSEGIDNAVSVTRTFSKYMPKWYILSESVYDTTGIDRFVDFDRLRNRRKMNTRSDIMNYAKSHDNASVMKFESVQTYKIHNQFGYAPSDVTPLYESVMLVKFDENDNIEERIYIGNNRIQ